MSIEQSIAVHRHRPPHPRYRRSTRSCQILCTSTPIASFYRPRCRPRCWAWWTWYGGIDEFERGRRRLRRVFMRRYDGEEVGNPSFLLPFSFLNLQSSSCFDLLVNFFGGRCLLRLWFPAESMSRAKADPLGEIHPLPPHLILTRTSTDLTFILGRPTLHFQRTHAPHDPHRIPRCSLTFVAGTVGEEDCAGRFGSGFIGCG